uniref:SWIM-type domain-containing protein n=1 Tax=Steinernema glaseri TaxID=37863 RepID=A0A1I7Y5S2_9BILA
MRSGLRVAQTFIEGEADDGRARRPPSSLEIDRWHDMVSRDGSGTLGGCLTIAQSMTFVPAAAGCSGGSRGVSNRARRRSVCDSSSTTRVTSDDDEMGKSFNNGKIVRRVNPKTAARTATDGYRVARRWRQMAPSPISDSAFPSGRSHWAPQLLRVDHGREFPRVGTESPATATGSSFLSKIAAVIAGGPTGHYYVRYYATRPRSLRTGYSASHAISGAQRRRLPMCFRVFPLISRTLCCNGVVAYVALAGHPNDAWLMEQVEQNIVPPAVAVGGQAIDGGMAPPAAPDDEDDRATFEDSEMFEEDLISGSDNESVNQNWRGWQGSVRNAAPQPILIQSEQESVSIGGTPPTLKTLAARVAASTMSFEQLEMQNRGHAIPSDLFCYIIKHVFPQHTEDIRMYSFLTNGSLSEYDNGHMLFKSGAVRDPLQIGYHLTASVVSPNDPHKDSRSKGSYFVDIGIDRCCITSCTCSCSHKSSWCQHVVAVCFYRIHYADLVQYRGINWSSLNSLCKKDLLKLTQNFLNCLPRQYLPVMQRLIDALANPNSEISKADGAPDPTDGEHQEVPIWNLTPPVIKENIHKALTKICIPGPTVHCDINCLSSNLSPTLTEWVAIYRSMKSKDPEGLWNLLIIASDMLKRSDPNAIRLLHICTEALMSNEHVLYWWYITKLSQSGFWMFTPASKAHFQSANGNSSQFNCSSLCDEVVNMWRLAAMNPKWSHAERENLFNELREYHRTAVTTISQLLKRMSQNSDAHSAFLFTVMDQLGFRLGPENARFSVHYFPGFFDALSACMIDWQLTNINEVLAGKTTDFRGNFKASGDLPGAFSAHEFASEISQVYDMELPTLEDGKSKCVRRGIKKNRRVIQTRSVQARHMLQMDHAEISKRSNKHNQIHGRSPEEPTCSKSLEDAREKREKLLNDDFEQIAERLNHELTDLEARYSCCEALMAHGYTQQARTLAMSVAEEMNAEPIDLLSEIEAENEARRRSIRGF